MKDIMNFQESSDTISVNGVKELGATNAKPFRDLVCAALKDKHKFVEIDLSQTMFLDSCGLGALIGIHKAACNRKGAVRLVNPTPPVQQVLELTRMHRILEIVRR